MAEQNPPMTYKTGNVFEDIKTHKDYEFHTILCDPPYNLSSKWEIKNDKLVLKKGGDFMGKWDCLDENDLDTFFQESFRILKYGGYCVMFSIDRQAFAFQYFAVKNGFEVCQSLAWFFISSFPKSTDASKMIDKRLGAEREVVGKMSELNERYKTPRKGKEGYGNIIQSNVDPDITASSTPKAKQFDGYKYGIAPFKQATETILVFRKPPKESILDDILSEDEECSPSVVNVDGGRVPTGENLNGGIYSKTKKGKNLEVAGFHKMPKKEGKFIQPPGRYPSTIFVDDGMAENLGEASKILHKCSYDEEEYNLLNYEPKVSKSERNAGLEGFEEKEARSWHFKCKKCGKTYSEQGYKSGCKCNTPDPEGWTGTSKNNHPTCKPISLIQRIATLFKLPTEQNLYIPFAGVASEIIGATLAGLEDITAVEINEEYVKIGEARIKHWTKQDRLV